MEKQDAKKDYKVWNPMRGCVECENKVHAVLTGMDIHEETGMETLVVYEVAGVETKVARFYGPRSGGKR